MGYFARLLGVNLCVVYLLGTIGALMLKVEMNWLAVIAILLAANGLIAWGNGYKEPTP